MIQKLRMGGGGGLGEEIESANYVKHQHITCTSTWLEHLLQNDWATGGMIEPRSHEAAVRTGVYGPVDFFYVLYKMSTKHVIQFRLQINSCHIIYTSGEKAMFELQKIKLKKCKQIMGQMIKIEVKMVKPM